jgi:hypothetical protein
MLDRAKAVFDIIHEKEKPFPKTALTSAGLSPKAASNWLDLIVYIQEQPKIRVTKTDRNTIVEKIGGKFSQMSLQFFLDEDKPIDQRLKSLEAYASSILVTQRLFKD